MYVDDIKNDFYEALAGKRIFIIVNYDIDGICSSRILQTLLKHRHTSYSLGVICGTQDLRRLYNEHCDDVKYFVLINCGGTIDLVELLEPEQDVIFFIIDSHRPTDLCNVYNSGQVKVLRYVEGEPSVPEFTDVFREDTSDEEAEDTDGDEQNPVNKRRRLDEESIMKRRERRQWEENRSRLLFEYTQFTYYAKASALLFFDLAWQLNRDNKDLLWLAIVSLTEQVIFAKIDETTYILEVGVLQQHVTRLQNRTNDTDTSTSLKISFENDLRLCLYRHWSVESSLKYSMYTACNMRLWSLKGDKKLQELLADMGLPLVQSKQNFRSMDLELRKEFNPSLERLSEKYNLPDIMFTSFTLQYGYRNQYCASDIVYSLLSLLEASSSDKTREERFHMALDCLSRSKPEILNEGLDRGKTIIVTLFRTVQNAVEMKQIRYVGPFVYYIVQETSLHWYMFSHQHVLTLLAHFMQRAYAAMCRNRKGNTVPLVISVPSNAEMTKCVIMGIPPICEKSPKNFFGKAFEQAAEKVNCDSDCDFFDTSIFEVPIKDRTRFLDALIALLS